MGRTQPVNWKDAGEALGHDELKGCLMPNGAGNFLIRPGWILMWAVTGRCADVNPPGAYLQYNEVRHVSELLCTQRTGRLNLFFLMSQYIVYDTAQIRTRYLLMVRMN